MAPRWVEIDSRLATRHVDLGEIVEHRGVLVSLAARQLRARYKQTALGVGWVIIQPLSSALVFTVAFGRIVGVPSDGIPYAVFVYAATLLWTYFAGTVESTTRSFVEAREMITKVYFPRLIVPLAGLLPRCVDVAVSLVVLTIFAAVTGALPESFAAAATIPLWLAALVCVTFATGVWLSALNVRYRDVGQSVTLLLQLWLFLSPVVFPSSAVHGAARTALAANPMTGIIDGFRWAAIGGPPPPLIDLLSAATAATLLGTGLWYFQRVERLFADDL